VSPASMRFFELLAGISLGKSFLYARLQIHRQRTDRKAGLRHAHRSQRKRCARGIGREESVSCISGTLTEQSKQQASTGSRRVSPKYLTVFYNQLSDLLKSGVPLLRSLQLLEDQTSHATLKLVIQDVREQVADGTRLNDAMRRHPKTFNFLTVSMVKAGEEGGFLEDVLAELPLY
jgi:type II secretory pathway component PulF